MQGAQHGPAIRLCGYDGGWGGAGQSAWPSSELLTSYTTPGKMIPTLTNETLSGPGLWDDWRLACRGSSSHLSVCWTIGVHHNHMDGNLPEN